MAIDTTAHLAILGAGPTGLEAALYARFLGYDVVLYEQGDVAASLRSLGSQPLTTPFRLHHSPLGLAALQAQDESYQTPDPDAVLTCGEWVARYLAPLAATDLLSDHLRLHTTVVAIQMKEPEENSSEDEEDHDRSTFRVQSRTAGEERDETFDGILDCTGVQNHRGWLGICAEPIRSSFQTDVPNYYVLGGRSRGQQADFGFQDGLAQIRELFAILGDRANLDLYAGARRLLR